jgi:GPH family glycoside/pentoside/hexuronide:cation symporter
VRFPKGIAQAAGAGLAPEMQARLVMIWGPVAAVIAVVALVIFVSYNISRVRHDQIAAALGRGKTAPDPITD